MSTQLQFPGGAMSQQTCQPVVGSGAGLVTCAQVALTQANIWIVRLSCIAVSGSFSPSNCAIGEVHLFVTSDGTTAQVANTIWAAYSGNLTLNVYASGNTVYYQAGGVSNASYTMSVHMGL
jgi:hypothetical protein